MTKIYEANIYEMKGKKWELVNTVAKTELEVFKEYFNVMNGISMNHKVKNIQFTSDGTLLKMETFRNMETSDGAMKKWKCEYLLKEEK